jgi:hypothetical protein
VDHGHIVDHRVFHYRMIIKDLTLASPHRINVDQRSFTVMGLLRSAIFGMALLLLTSCAVLGDGYYSADAIEAWVVDQQTKKPLEGVIVVAQWQLMRNAYHGRVPVGTMMVMETVTDTKGRFSFPSWGPIANTTDGHLDDEDPQIYLFKPAYYLFVMGNNHGFPYSDKPSRRTSDWNGQTINLGLFPGTAEEYAEHVARQSQSILRNPMTLTLNCDIVKMPMLAEAFDRENRMLEARGYKRGGFVFSSLSSESVVKCGVSRSSGEK